ncbi:restriction endonuclease subunit S [Lysinibacillus boronitolerans]|uniref:restriction endonuclease subunit S n=1 Tax=Lysinibacillus boronitolerans TaxID=309788 RepID=UPI00031E5536|nr:restriction endonuclease subunit S [Lysinibacillus boronitolerans]
MSKIAYPNDWKVMFVDDFAEITTGNKDTINKIDNGEYPFFVRSQQIERINSYTYEGEAVLTAGDGVGVGKVFHYINGKFDYHQRVYKISDFKDVDGKYFYYFFSKNFIKQVKKFNAKTSVDSVRREMISKMKVPVPSYKEQKKIVSILNTWEKAIELKEKLVEQKKEQKKGLMQKLLTGDLRLSGFNNPWENRKLSDLCSKIMDGTHSTPKYTQEGVPFYSVENVTSRDFRNHKYISEKEHALISARCKVEKGDILMTRIGSIGDAVIVDWDYESSIYVSLALLKTNDLILSKYLVQYMATNKFKKEILSKSLLNAIPQKINLVDLNKLNIYYPQDLNEQNAIVSILENADREISLLAKELKEIKLQKQALMQQLLIGKIRVKV